MIPFPPHTLFYLFPPAAPPPHLQYTRSVMCISAMLLDLWVPSQSRHSPLTVTRVRDAKLTSSSAELLSIWFLNVATPRRRSLRASRKRGLRESHLSRARFSSSHDASSSLSAVRAKILLSSSLHSSLKSLEKSGINQIKTSKQEEKQMQNNNDKMDGKHSEGKNE